MQSAKCADLSPEQRSVSWPKLRRSWRSFRRSLSPSLFSYCLLGAWSHPQAPRSHSALLRLMHRWHGHATSTIENGNGNGSRTGTEKKTGTGSISCPVHTPFRPRSRPVHAATAARSTARSWEKKFDMYCIYVLYNTYMQLCM